MKYLIGSLVVHGVFVYLLIAKKEIPQPQMAKNFIVFKDTDSFPSVNKEPSSQKSKRISDGKSQSAQRRGKTKGKLENLLRQSITDLSVAEVGSSDAAFLEDGSLGGERYFKDAVELPRPLEQVWRQIRAHIHFHPDFFIGNIQGQVMAQILINEGGKLLSLRGINGHSDLVEWVKVSISNALEKEFLRHRISKKMMLELKFSFAIVGTPPPIEDYTFRHTNLEFNILGYRDPSLAAAGSVKDMFKDKKMYRQSEWNFSKRLEPYYKACYVHKNPIGCNKLREAYMRAGLQSDAQAVQKLPDLDF
ncbi:MAG: hypothetical protein IT287_05300 [Bdellovibrionaceae bacterium]|nr:hypothetical protein [Pseudobdellovibrionaceae bacterium]